MQWEYDGASCAWRFGLATCVCCPCSLDEGKIPLSVGDIITVTRWQRSVDTITNGLFCGSSMVVDYTIISSMVVDYIIM